MDPGARIAFDCISGMDFDWPRMGKVVRSYTQCPLEEFHKERGDYVSTWIGYYLHALDEYTMRTVPWQYLFMGGTHITWWPAAGAFTPDLSEPYLCMTQATDEMREIRSGVGQFLLNSHKRLDPILILWSNLSYHASILNPLDVTWRQSKRDFKNMLRRIGLDFQSVGPDYVQTKLLCDDGHRVLILPACQAMSRETAQAIESFARSGGLVIADFKPAVFDEYLRPYGKQKDVGGRAELAPCPACKGSRRVEVGNVWQACPTCGGTGKIVKGGSVPDRSALAGLFDFSKKGAKKCGKGRGLFLNGPLGGEDEWNGLRRILVEHGGIRSDLEVRDAAGSLRTDLRSYLFDSGESILLGLLPDRSIKSPPGAAASIELARSQAIPRCWLWL